MGDRPGETQVVKYVFRVGGAGLDSNAESAGGNGEVHVIGRRVAIDKRVGVPGELQVDRFAGRDTGVPVTDSTNAGERQSHHDRQCKQHGEDSLFHDVHLFDRMIVIGEKQQKSTFVNLSIHLSSCTCKQNIQKIHTYEQLFVQIQIIGPDQTAGAVLRRCTPSYSISTDGRLHARFMISWKNVKYAYGVSFTPM